ncbi:MAG: DUF4364 family protein [Oscillospiraceae bacterium]|jgi:predicted transcriptional regulator|nr:DUF4364 family protein [Oscillospiraceae bacterium]
MPEPTRGDAELKILILFALRKLALPAPIETVAELAMRAPGFMTFTYFDVTTCVDSLVKTGHLAQNSGEYTITEKGVRVGEETESDVPFSVRRHTEQAAIELRQRAERARLIKTSRTIRRRGGYTVELTISDGKDEALHLRLPAADEQHAEKTERALAARAEDVFAAVMKTLFIS